MSKVRLKEDVKLTGFKEGGEYEVVREDVYTVDVIDETGSMRKVSWRHFEDMLSQKLDIKQDKVKKDLKYDNGKNELSLIDPDFILGVGEVLTFGAKKYEANSWQTLENGKKRYEDALLRHTMAYLKGEKLDQESNISHLKHMATNIMFLQYFEEKTDAEDEDKIKKMLAAIDQRGKDL